MRAARRVRRAGQGNPPGAIPAGRPGPTPTAVYQSAGKKADGLVNLYCLAHIRRYFVRAGDANPAQLGHWTAAWLDRIRDLYAAHAQLMTAWQEAAPLDAALAAWDEAIGAIDEAHREQAKAPGLQEPARKASRPSTGNGRVCPRTGTTR